ncbi:MAG TPA: hypothetical protein PKZ84_06790 [Anaerolineae bacterium]|nr:hypothetical protein [Anaerolineae bacterium]HQI83394.1 hypothetical protein [Anaerolineae bacterium]
MHTNVLCVAPKEAQAAALSDAVTAVPDVLVVGICDPQKTRQMLKFVDANLIVTLEGTEIPDVEKLSIPVLPVPEKEAAEVLTAYLEAQAPQQPPAQPTTPASATTATTPRLPFAPIPRQLRLGFYGTRGGTGTTTAVVTAAKLLAAQGKSVALYDAAQRGDPYLLLDLTPSDQPASSGRITIYPDLVLDDARVSYNAILVDGGRERRAFPARWIVVDRPLSENDIARLLGITLPTPSQEAAQC